MNRLLVVYKAPVHSVYLFFIFEGVLNFIKKIGFIFHQRIAARCCESTNCLSLLLVKVFRCDDGHFNVLIAISGSTQAWRSFAFQTETGARLCPQESSV